MKSLIRLCDISFSYSEREEAVLKDFSLEIEEGSCVIVKGDNGSGKSTLFRVINGLSFPQKGEYYFDGALINRAYLDINTNSKSFHKRIGYLFQNPDVMLFNPSVFDEVAFGPRQMGISDEEVYERTIDCMKLFAVSSLKEKAPYHLSGGQKKRVALAAVLALNPDVLVLDEPFAGMDGGMREWFVGFLSEFKASGKTLIIATHNEVLCEGICDRYVEM